MSTINSKIASETILQNAPIINGCRFCHIPTELLVVHPHIQRPPRGHEHAIAKQWDDNKCGQLTVSYHDDEGLFYIVDGQHRFLAAQIAGVSRLVCRVFTGLTLQQEANLFTGQTENHRKLSLRDSFPARIVAGDTIATSISRICREYSLCITKKGDEDVVFMCLNTLYNIYSIHGEVAVRFIFEFLRKTGWVDDKYGTGKDLIQALARVYKHKDLYGLNDTATLDAVIARCRGVDVKEFTANAVSNHPRGSTSMAITRYIEDISAECAARESDIQQQQIIISAS